VIATKTALKLADYVVTEAGFGADLGAEKFFDIKCRSAGLSPDAAVIVATIRALKMHGGVALADLGKENVDAVAAGCSNLARHIRNVKSFGVPVVVAINRFSADTDAEVTKVSEAAEQYGVTAIDCTHWADGGAGTEDLAHHVVKMTAANNSQFSPLYDSDMPIWDKMRTIATRIYGAEDIIADKKVRDQIDQFQEGGFGNLPICVAKTQYSFSTDPNLKGAPSGHVVPIREVRLSAGAGFLVFVCGEIMTMPGLPRVPAADKIHIDDDGLIQGLF
jgi:formate--tetrahydrofolate ligase